MRFCELNKFVKEYSIVFRSTLKLIYRLFPIVLYTYCLDIFSIDRRVGYSATSRIWWDVFSYIISNRFIAAIFLIFQIACRQRRRCWAEKWSLVCVCLLNLYYRINLSICGTLHSVDQYLNIKLTDISVTDTEKYPHMVIDMI